MFKAAEGSVFMGGQIYIRDSYTHTMKYCIKCDVKYKSKSGSCPSCDGKGVKYEEQDKD